MFYATGMGGAIAPVYRKEDTARASELICGIRNQSSKKTPERALVTKDQERSAKQA